MDRFLELRRALEERVLKPSRDHTPQIAAWIRDIRDRADRITDEQVADLRTRHSDDELFEILVEAAVGAAKHRVEAGLEAIAQAKSAAAKG